MPSILDMTGFKSVTVDTTARTMTVQSGATWHDIQNVLHPRFAVKAMQSTDIFTVGGSISVNAHGMDHRAGSVGQLAALGARHAAGWIGPPAESHGGVRALQPGSRRLRVVRRDPGRRDRDCRERAVSLGTARRGLPRLRTPVRAGAAARPERCAPVRAPIHRAGVVVGRAGAVRLPRRRARPRLRSQTCHRWAKCLR